VPLSLSRPSSLFLCLSCPLPPCVFPPHHQLSPSLFAALLQKHGPYLTYSKSNLTLFQRPRLTTVQRSIFGCLPRGSIKQIHHHLTTISPCQNHVISTTLRRRGGNFCNSPTRPRRRSARHTPVHELCTTDDPVCVCVCVCACVFVYVCVRVCKREKMREREREIAGNEER
jgi:hypothetical protein